MQEKVLNFKDVSARIRSEMNIMDQIQSSLFLQLSSEGKKSTFEDALDKIDRGSDNEIKEEHALQDDQETEVLSQMMKARRIKMLEKIKQYQTMKEILDRNCQTLGISFESIQYLDISPAYHQELQ